MQCAKSIIEAVAQPVRMTVYFWDGGFADGDDGPDGYRSKPLTKAREQAACAELFGIDLARVKVTTINNCNGNTEVQIACKDVDELFHLLAFGGNLEKITPADTANHADGMFWATGGDVFHRSDDTSFKISPASAAPGIIRQLLQRSVKHGLGAD